VKALVKYFVITPAKKVFLIYWVFFISCYWFVKTFKA